MAGSLPKKKAKEWPDPDLKGQAPGAHKCQMPAHDEGSKEKDHLRSHKWIIRDQYDQ